MTYPYQLKDLIFVFFKAACHANPEVERNFEGSSSHISGNTS